VGATSRSSPAIWLHQPLFGHPPVTRRDAALRTRELATLLNAGLTVDQSLRLMIDLVEDHAARKVIADLLELIQGGSSLADALARHAGAFSQAYVSMVRADEAGGSLDEVLALASRAFLDQAESLNQQVRSALVSRG
jgi:general secretion pathway protein F